jgi:hypothetical protein
LFADIRDFPSWGRKATAHENYLIRRADTKARGKKKLKKEKKKETKENVRNNDEETTGEASLMSY